MKKRLSAQEEEEFFRHLGYRLYSTVLRGRLLDHRRPLSAARDYLRVNQLKGMDTGSDFSYSGSADFALTAASCILTYNGTSGKSFLVMLSVSFDPTTANTGSCAAVIDRNNTFNGASPAATDASTAAGAQSDAIASSGDSAGVTCQRRVTLNNGDTLRPLAAYFTLPSQDMNITSLSFTVLPQ